MGMIACSFTIMGPICVENSLDLKSRCRFVWGEKGKLNLKKQKEGLHFLSSEIKKIIKKNLKQQKKIRLIYQHGILFVTPNFKQGCVFVVVIFVSTLVIPLI